jgi:Cu+-exporting ATPase
MSCAACAAHAQKRYRSRGVESGDVNIATEKLRVSFAENKVDFETLHNAVEDAGYGLVEENLKTVELDILGMSCAACSAAVERALKKLPGVREATVNLATNRARVEYDTALLRLSQIRQAVADAGTRPGKSERARPRRGRRQARGRACKKRAGA